MNKEEYLKIFKKYISLDSLDFEQTGYGENIWDCSIVFNPKMFEELGIKYHQIKFDTLEVEGKNENLVFALMDDDTTWLWAVVEKPFTTNRKKVGVYTLYDSETGVSFEKEFPEISMYLKEYLTPLLDKLVKETDFH